MKTNSQLIKEERVGLILVSNILFIDLKVMKNSLENENGDSSYNYMLQEHDEMQEMLDQGIITKEDYDLFKSKRLFSTKLNKGYAFVTFALQVKNPFLL